MTDLARELESMRFAYKAVAAKRNRLAAPPLTVVPDALAPAPAKRRPIDQVPYAQRLDHYERWIADPTNVAPLRAAAKAVEVALPTVGAVLRVMVSRARPDGTVSESIEQLAAACLGVPSRTVRKAVAALRESSTIKLVAQASGPGRGNRSTGKPATYRLAFLDAEQAATPSRKQRPVSRKQRPVPDTPTVITTVANSHGFHLEPPSPVDSVAGAPVAFSLSLDAPRENPDSEVATKRLYGLDHACKSRDAFRAETVPGWDTVLDEPFVR